MKLKIESERLEKEIEEIFESRNESLIGDGIISYENYLNAKYRILWVLKEPYDDFDERGNPVGGGWHFREAFLPKKTKSDFNRRSLATYDPMLYITYSVQNNFVKWDDMPWSKDTPEMVETFKSIAYMNVKKTPGMKVSNDGVLYGSYQKNKKILIKQVNTYAADLIIFGNTFKYFREDLGFSDSDLNKEKESSYWVKRNGSIYISAFHPAQRKASTGISKEQYINEIIEIAEQQLNKK